MARLPMTPEEVAASFGDLDLDADDEDPEDDDHGEDDFEEEEAEPDSGQEREDELQDGAPPVMVDVPEGGASGDGRTICVE